VDSKIGDLSVSDSTFGGEVDLTGSSIASFRFPCRRSQTVFVSWSQFGPRWLASARSAKQHLKEQLSCWHDNFKAIGHDHDALTAHREAVKIDRELHSWHSAAWMFSWVPELRDGYGTRAWQPLAVSLVIILAWGFFYALVNPFNAYPATETPIAKSPLLVFSLVYSLETFIPIFNVTGIKKWGWRIESRARWAEVLEAILGGLFSLLAVFSVTAYLL
jgi:hypothetical protein